MMIDRLNHLRNHFGLPDVSPKDIYTAGPRRPYYGFNRFLSDLDNRTGIYTGGCKVGTRIKILESKIRAISREEFNSAGTYFWLGAG